ncbi:TonB-dependent receptor [Salegentibacter sp. JZCK2]|uniref:TonB-dependent receptor n=1 Tax=Salegentibacter tibetensis TaxID=2873600 RepID=UPI001CCBCECF|nr:TonB-dependent receptor [Salegentibacter tibetensis]MBZ9728225.1 TonB-dependent receptor [Salegentibacter tibetensis]
MKYSFLILLFELGFSASFAQEISLEGKLVDAQTYKELSGAKLHIEKTIFETFSDENGTFSFTLENLPLGEQVLNIVLPDYNDLRIPIVIEAGTSKDLGLILMQPVLVEYANQISTISLSDAELDEDEAHIDNLSGLLQASRDVFLNAAAFDFSQTFFRPRGLDSEHGKVLINGVGMNKIYTGRPQWSNWGGLNDMQRNQVFSMGQSPSEVSFGGLAGTTNIIMRASKYAKGGKASIAAANRSYNGRVMASYGSGELKNGWAYAISASRRFAKEAYVEGTLYDANAFSLSVEKTFNKNHSLNFTGFYTPNIRGKSSPNTAEVFELKGRKYNAYWGYQDGEIRNSRVREIKEPVLMLNHFWEFSEKISISNNFAFQFGKMGNSRIDFGGTRMAEINGQNSYVGGGTNPDPTYYQKLPSYYLRFSDNPNYEAAYLAQQDFKENGQLNWEQLYSANNAAGYTVYALAEDRSDDLKFDLNSIVSAKINDNISLDGKLAFSYLNSHNFASIKDMLGGETFLDIDFFAEGDEETSLEQRAQSDLQNPNRSVLENTPYKYNFRLYANTTKAFGQLNFDYDRLDFYAGITASQTAYQREGLFQNGNFPDNSLGNSEQLNFTDFGGKIGANYKFTAKHLFGFNVAWFTKPPNLRNSFSNSRQNNEVVIGLTSEQLQNMDFSYRYRSTNIKARLSAYYTQIKDATEISFYYADGLSGLGRNSTTAFVQEVLSGIDKQHLGLELGIEAQLTSAIKLKAAAAMGQFTYNNNPELYLTSDDFNDILDYGTSYLKNYRIAGGPQRAAQIGFEYRDPGYWWFGTTINFFSHAFLDISPLTRTSNFLNDTDGLPILNYDENIASNLLKQEQFGNYMLVNAIGGKSWLIKGKFIGFFVSLNNIFDKLYKTGGFEQSRNANYRTLKQDRERENPIFGPKYWYGTGASYFAMLYVRF